MLLLWTTTTRPHVCSQDGSQTFSLEVSGCSRRTSVDTADLCYSKWNIWPCLFSEIDPTLCFKFIFIYQGKYVRADPVWTFVHRLLSSLRYWRGLTCSSDSKDNTSSQSQTHDGLSCRRTEGQGSCRMWRLHAHRENRLFISVQTW